jgi:hypothetical protein
VLGWFANLLATAWYFIATSGGSDVVFRGIVPATVSNLHFHWDYLLLFKLRDWCAVLCCECHVVLCRLQLELQGAAIAFACSQGTTAFLLVLYTIVRDVRMASRGAENATWCRPNMTMFSGNWVGG